MRLWHQDLIPYLPKDRVNGQHRECCGMRGKGWGRRHSVVDYVFTYSIMRLYYYHMLIMKEAVDRGINIDPIWYDPNYRGKILGFDMNIDRHEPYPIGKVYREHDDAYMVECIENLKQKGIILNIDKKIFTI